MRFPVLLCSADRVWPKAREMCEMEGGGALIWACARCRGAIMRDTGDSVVKMLAALALPIFCDPDSVGVL